MPRAPDPLDILKLDKERALRLATKLGPERMRRLMERAQKDLDRRLRSREILVGARGEDTFTTAQMRATLAQVREVLREIAPGMRGAIVETGHEAAAGSAEASLRYLQDAEARYRGIVRPLPLDHAAMFDRATQAAESSLLSRILSDPSHRGHRGVLDRYGDAVIGRFEEQLSLRLAARRSIAETRQALIDESPFLKGAPLYWAERIVRTESINASNAASQETIVAADEELGGMLKILSAVFDSRTAADSYAVHGQIRRAKEPFDTWQGATMHPPARPNDRETVVPHRQHWPIPSQLKPKSDGEVAARWAQEGRKGSPPSRPKLSTVDVETIGARGPAAPPTREEVERRFTPRPPAAPAAKPAAVEPSADIPAANVPRFRNDRDRGRFALDQLGRLPRWKPDELGAEFDAIRNPIPPFTESFDGYAKPPWSEAKQARLEELTSKLRKLETETRAPALRQVRIDELRSMSPDLLRENVMKGAGEAFFGEKGDVPIVVRSGGGLYVYENVERVAAVKLGARKTIAVHVIDLDARKPWKDSPAPAVPETKPKAPPIPLDFLAPADFARSIKGRARNVETVAHAAKTVFRSEKIPKVESLEKVWGSEAAGHKIEIKRVSGSASRYDGGSSVSYDGRILNAKGRAIGTITRTFTRHANGELEVHHDYFKIEDVEEQGKKTGESMLRQSIQAYEALGVNKLTVDAAWVGRYAWATFGYNWSAEKATDVADRFARYLKMKGVEESRARDIARKTSPRSWDVAAVDVDGITVPVDSEGKVFDMKLGKAFLLEHTEHSGDMWSGMIRIDDKNSESYKRAASRVGL